MGFVTPLLLAGAGLIAVPIVLHLIMRREAQHLLFPALRFVQQRRTVNQHRLRLRHLLLLALRCAIIALLAFALARPMLRGSGAAANESAPVATALVFDNSSRMQYEHENRSRLAQAKELAAWILDQIPAESPVTVVDRAGRQRGQELDRGGAELRVERLEFATSVRSMEDALRDAARWIESKPSYRGEIYAFTDLSSDAWPPAAAEEFAKRLNELPGTNVYLIDVGVKEPRNLELGALRLSSERLTPSAVLQLRSELSRVGNAGDTNEATVELYVGEGAEMAKRGQQLVAPTTGQPAPVEFSLTGLPLGTHQGMVRIGGGDALPCDDARYFTIEVRPARKVLLVGQRTEDTVFLREALSPSAAAGAAASNFACDVGDYGKLESQALAAYTAVCLLDPPPLPTATWKALADFAERGGGVGVFLGRRARSNEFNTPEAQQLLPAKLRWVSREATYLRPVAVEHPALADLRELGDAVPWPEFPVFRYWELEGDAESGRSPTAGTGTGAGAKPQAAAAVVATYANGKPALVERSLGGGRVLMLTTSLSDAAHDDPWNLLPTGPEPWPFLALANGVADYLSGAGESRLNYLAGQTVVLPLAAEEQVSSYALQMPDGSALRQSLAPGQADLTFSNVEALGNYRVRAGGRQEKLDRGFSVNLPAEATRLERASETELIKSLGAERARVARTREEIEVRVGQGRVGRELFPALIIAVALVLAAEQWLANRFYAQAATSQPPTKSWVARPESSMGSASDLSPPRTSPTQGAAADGAGMPAGGRAPLARRG